MDLKEIILLLAVAAANENRDILLAFFVLGMLKICMEKKRFRHQDYAYFPITDYLISLPGDGFFYFNERENLIVYIFDSPEWGDRCN